MTTTTVLSDDTATIVGDDSSRFNWGAAIAGALIATAVTFLLVTLGSGIGLALVSVPHTTTTGWATFLTAGAIYVFAAQAFGFAAGAHVTGRLIGPAIENSKEEEFRAGAHGLAVWALAIVAGLAVLALTAASGAAAKGPQAAPASYWADMLLVPSGPGTPASVTNDKLEAGRLLALDLVGPTNGGANRDELTRLVMQDTGLRDGATARVDAVEAQMRDDANAARKAASIAAVWTALALLFGAVVSVAAAISARWEDDRISFGWAPRR
jgi:hypothetical protein